MVFWIERVKHSVLTVCVCVCVCVVCVCVEAKHLMYRLWTTVSAAVKQHIVPLQEYCRRTIKIRPIARRQNVLFRNSVAFSFLALQATLSKKAPTVF